MITLVIATARALRKSFSALLAGLRPLAGRRRKTTFGKAGVPSVYRVSGGAGPRADDRALLQPDGRFIQLPGNGTFDEYLTYNAEGSERAR